MPGRLTFFGLCEHLPQEQDPEMLMPGAQLLCTVMTRMFGKSFDAARGTMMVALSMVLRTAGL